MPPEFFCVCFACLLVLCLQMMQVNVQNSQRAVILARTANGAKRLYARQTNIPATHVLLYAHDGHRRRLHEGFFLNHRVSLAERPVVGDHIHMAISFWIGHRARHAEHDRSPIHAVDYEPPFGKDEDVCVTPGPVAYHKVWSHVGVHTHCDGLIHVHPWSAPRAIRKEGLDVRLGLWFDQVGIAYREWPTVSLTFADGARYDSNATHQWHIAEKTCFRDPAPQTVYTEQLDDIWLGHAYAEYIAWFGLKGSEAPPGIERHLQHLERVGVHGAFDAPYPHTCHPAH